MVDESRAGDGRGFQGRFSVGGFQAGQEVDVASDGSAAYRWYDADAAEHAKPGLHRDSRFDAVLSGVTPGKRE